MPRESSKTGSGSSRSCNTDVIAEGGPLIVTSHRGPFVFRQEPDGSFRARRGAGGVVTALGPLLESVGPERVLWVAAAIGDGDRAASRAGAASADCLDLHLLDLDPHLHRLHYDVVSNSVLWFLHHGLFDLARRPSFDARFAEAWEAYVSVNRTFADAVAEAAEPREVVLTQDYQLALVPGMVHAARPDLRVVHFTHIPFCWPDSIRVLPDFVADQLCGAAVGIPNGFHSRRWANAFTASARAVLGDEAPLAPFVAPLGPDADALAEVATSDEARAAGAALDEIVDDRSVILRIDRIEPSKNIVRGFLAYDRLLDAHAEWRGRVVFVAMLYVSRSSLPEYRTYGDEVEQAAARVNERWSTPGWDPIVLDTRDDYARSVAGLGRYDALLVNSIKDGLNLVAEEGPLVNRRDGVVCLSRHAGAFDVLNPAVEEVHPFDLDQTAAALHRALALPPDQRAVRAARLRELAASRDPRVWLGDLLERAGGR